MTAFLVVGVAAVLGLAGLLAYLRSAREHCVAAAATTALHVDDDRVERHLADGRVEAVRWSEIREVEVITTDIGVHRDDGALVVLAVDETRGCLVPSGLAVAHGVIDRLTRLPGFDARRLAAALEEPAPSRTTCWTRPGPEAGDAGMRPPSAPSSP